MQGGTKILLVLPPVLPRNEFPEVGPPQLVAYLRRHGVDCEQRDLNTELLYDYLAQGARPSKIAAMTRRSRAAKPLVLPAATAEHLTQIREWCAAVVQALHLAPEPFTLDAMAGAVAQGHRVYELFFEERLFAAAGAAPGILGLTIMSSSQLLPALILARRASVAWPRTVVVIGGPWVNAAGAVLPTFLARMPWIHAAIRGRGEGSLLALARAVERGDDVGTVPNLVGQSGCGPAMPSVPLGEIPPPCFDGLALDRYPVRLLPIQTNTRCYWGKCVFCYHDDNRVPLEQRAGREVAGALMELRNRYDTGGFFLADTAAPPAMMSALADELIAMGADLGWSAMARATPEFDLDLCTKLHRSGCRAILFGLETASRPWLAKLRKGITLEAVDAAVRTCGQAGIAAYLFVLDHPGNTRVEFEATLSFLVEHAQWVEDFTVSRFQLSELSRTAEAAEVFGIERKVASDTWLDVFDVPFTAPNQLSLVEHEQLVARYTAAFRAARGRSSRGPFLRASGH